MKLLPTSVATATAVVLLHGLNSTPEEFVFMQAVLKRHHYEVVALTIPGFSYQPQRLQTSDVSFEKWLAHLKEQVEDIKSQYDKVVMVGISAGANLALAMALQSGSLCRRFGADVPNAFFRWLEDTLVRQVTAHLALHTIRVFLHLPGNISLWRDGRANSCLD
jgi:alpha-beta hydrolase superfamily lysophospholipase